MTIEDILDKARWFYIPYRPYKSFYHLIVQDAEEEWKLYYLERLADSANLIPDISDIGDLSVLSENPKQKSPNKERKERVLHLEIPKKYANESANDIFRQIEKEDSKQEEGDRNISGCVVQRKVQGNLGAMIHEFLKIVK